MGYMFFSNFSCQPYVINIQLRKTDNICTDLHILLKPQSKLGYLGSEVTYNNYSKTRNLIGQYPCRMRQSCTGNLKVDIASHFTSLLRA